VREEFGEESGLSVSPRLVPQRVFSLSEYHGSFGYKVSD
jgi:hypothetical protein